MPPETPIPLRAAGLLITEWCPVRCRHCYVGAGPDRTGWMRVDAARAHLAALGRMGVPAEGIHIGGGEPFGNPDRLLDIVRAARDVGLDGVGYVETSAFWAGEEGIVRDRLASLAQAGMRQIAISADPYHQEFVPPERVRRLYEVAREVLGPGGVRARRWTWLKALRDVSRMAEADRRRLFGDFLRRYPERMTGRAASTLAPLLDRRPAADLPRDGCRASLLGSGHVHVLPDGWVYPGTCAGIVLGRATADVPLDAVVGGWRPEASPLVGRLVDGGPRALVEVAEAHGFRPDPTGYAGPCHLCWSVRRFLVGADAEAGELGPRRVYGRPCGPT